MWYRFLKRYKAWNKTPSPVVSHNKEGKNDEVRQEDKCPDWCCGHALLCSCLRFHSAGDGGSTGSSDKKIELTVWSWDSTLPRTVKGFEAKNPNIKVKVTNAGTNKDEYNALSNAIEAGSGAPDIAQIEYYALPEYVIRGHLENLSDLGASDFKDFYTPVTWSSVNINDGVYALPMDSGPMDWFYY